MKHHRVGTMLCLVGLLSLSAAAKPLMLYVATDGDDAWSGRRARRALFERTNGPFRSLERARDEIRRLKQQEAFPATGVIVEVRAGEYRLDTTFELTAEDSGTEDGPIIYRARSGGQVRLTGAKALTGFERVRSADLLARLDESARGKVYQVDLKVLGISEYGDLSGGFGRPSGYGAELFFNDRPMTVARWPNDGFEKITGLVGGEPVDVRGTKGDKIGKFSFGSDRAERWIGEKDLWVHGYWFWDWADQRHQVESIDLDTRVISVVPPYHGYGYRVGQWFYVYNALSEIDQPGEWCLDRENGMLYFWPPSPLDEGRPVLSTTLTLINVKEASHVTFRGFTIEAARAVAVRITDGRGNRIVGCTLRNIGGQAIAISGGAEHSVIGCDVYDIGDGGVSASGGDRPTLTPAKHQILNNNIHHYGRWNRMYKVGVSIGGVGQRVAHNLIHNAPHCAIAFSGNDHRIELNEIHSVCHESNDAGAIYGGRDWTQRGTVIEHNYMHHINGFQGRGCVGVYFDDMLSGNHILGNVFYRVTRAAFIGGGRDCRVENNIFADCPRAIHIDARALGWAKASVTGTMKTRLDAMPYRNELWRQRYPKLVDVWDDEPAKPKGNTVARNIVVGENWDSINAHAKPYVDFFDNLINEDPHFVNADLLDFRLRESSPAWALGFQRIPIENMGPYRDATRASWPIEHQVRPLQQPQPKEKAAAPRGPAPVFTVRKTTAPVTIDGAISPAEWGGAKPADAMVIEEGIEGQKIDLRSLVWLLHDRTSLFIAVDNAVDPWVPLRTGNTWGRDDAVEIAVRMPTGGRDAPILILRGFPSGHFLSSNEAGAPEELVRQAAEGVEYRAQVVESGQWTCEWKIPLAALGIDPAKHRNIAFNLSVRKSAQPLWMMWRGTAAHTWRVEQAGTIVLEQ